MYGLHSHLVIRTGPETCLFLNAVAVRGLKKVRLGKMYGERFYLKADITIPEVLLVADNLASGTMPESVTSPLGNSEIERILEGPSGLHESYLS